MPTDLRDLFFSTGDEPPPVESHSTIQQAKYERLRRDYRDFCYKIIGCPPAPDDQSPWHPTPPTVPHIKAFLNHYARTKKGVLEENGKCTVKTLENDWQNMQRDICRHTGHRYNQQEKDHIKRFIRQDLTRTEGVSTKVRPKAIADAPVIQDLLSFLWQYDEKDLFPRVRLQIATALSFLWYLGLRTGELLESRGASLKNEGVLWKDVHIYKVEVDGVARFHAQIHVRNRKGKKGREDCIEIENLREEEDQSCRWRCPLTLILGLAIADRAIAGIETIEDLETVRFLPGRPSRELRIRPKMQDIPLLRRQTQGSHGKTSKDQILYGAQLADQLKSLGHRAGYLDDLVPYSVRRGFGNSIDST